MQILTAKGRRNIHDAEILCVERPRTLGEHLLVTLYLLDGEKITGVVELSEPANDNEVQFAA